MSGATRQWRRPWRDFDPLEKPVDEFRCDLTQISLNDRGAIKRERQRLRERERKRESILFFSPHSLPFSLSSSFVPVSPLVPVSHRRDRPPGAPKSPTFRRCRPITKESRGFGWHDLIAGRGASRKSRG